jgi:hypothetical protein
MKSEKIKAHCFDIHQTDIKDAAALGLAVQARKRQNREFQPTSSSSGRKRKAEQPQPKIKVEKKPQGLQQKPRKNQATVI